MSLDKKQFRDLIERTLQGFDPVLQTPSAVELLLGTAAVESDFGTYLRQLGGGPALGAFQMEPKTFNWLRKMYQQHYPELAYRNFIELEWNLRLAIIMARLRYRIVKDPLPSENDIAAMAAYWKLWYNTMKGKGAVTDFVRKYMEYVK